MKWNIDLKVVAYWEKTFDTNTVFLVALKIPYRQLLSFWKKSLVQEVAVFCFSIALG